MFNDLTVVKWRLLASILLESEKLSTDETERYLWISISKHTHGCLDFEFGTILLTMRIQCMVQKCPFDRFRSDVALL